MRAIRRRGQIHVLNPGATSRYLKEPESFTRSLWSLIAGKPKFTDEELRDMGADYVWFEDRWRWR